MSHEVEDVLVRGNGKIAGEMGKWKNENERTKIAARSIVWP